VAVKRARIYDAIALFTVLLILALDQWTKFLVVTHLSPPESKPPISIIGKYLSIYYIQNNGAAFSMLDSNPLLLTVLIMVAIVVISYLYFRNLNTGSLFSKIIFGMIIGGAVGNLIDRARYGGYVVDFLSFRIPELNFSFAIFNIADACISVGVVLLFILVLWNGFHHSEQEEGAEKKLQSSTPSSSSNE
jgi:signal peptidase II